MARVNDNLFTSLDFGLNAAFSIRSRFGPIQLLLRSGRLAGLEFNEVVDAEEPVRRASSEEASAFGKAVARFEALQPQEREEAMDLVGSPFQKAVWRRLLAIPFGATLSYREIADAVGRPRAFRAVGSAIGANPISLLIPCHRVVRSDGELGGYRWGLSRKSELLEAEARGLNSFSSIFT